MWSICIICVLTISSEESAVSLSEHLLQSSLMREQIKPQQGAAEIFYSYANRLLALLLLVLFSPLMVAAALLVWLDGGGPILYGHWRVGHHGRLFRCLKFRTMVSNSEDVLRELLKTDSAARAEWDRDFKLTDDPRITAVGTFMRKTSLDEFPQLFNVLRGDMNLVGPRPVTFAELTRYGRVRWHYLTVRPGMTGLWQVSGRNNLTYPQRVELDRHYVELRSMLMDLKILLRTVFVVLARDGSR